MVIDRSHRPWLFGTTAVWAAATVSFAGVSVWRPDSARGGSASGLVFGIAGFAVMAFAGLLSARKKFPAAWAGRAQTWMRGHLWLGSLSLFLILYHAGFVLGNLGELHAQQRRLENALRHYRRP